MGERSPTDTIRLAATQSLRGILGVGVLWDAVVGCPTADDARATLDGLPFEVRVDLRAIHAAGPSSLVGGPPAGPAREVVRRRGEADPPGGARPPGPADTWAVWRIDDNANTFLVRGGLPRAEAERVAAEFAARGHKQTYWVERETAELTGAPVPRPASG